jgi:hypothetical protein
MAVSDIEKRIPFLHDDRLGFLTFCPTNLGTTVRASVHIKVPKLAADKAKLEDVASKYNLQVSTPLSYNAPHLYTRLLEDLKKRWVSDVSSCWKFQYYQTYI